jgi:uncharacterized protein YecE (DUF72 family)
LPPNFKKDVPRLREFFTCIPLERRLAFEFRHESWFDNETFELLRQRNVSLCIAEADEEEGVAVPFEPTADWGYLRLRRADYTDADLKQWADRIRKTNWKDAFIFFKHEDEGKGPQMATRFLQLYGA